MPVKLFSKVTLVIQFVYALTYRSAKHTAPRERKIGIDRKDDDQENEKNDQDNCTAYYSQYKSTVHTEEYVRN